MSLLDVGEVRKNLQRGALKIDADGAEVGAGRQPRLVIGLAAVDQLIEEEVEVDDGTPREDAQRVGELPAGDVQVVGGTERRLPGGGERAVQRARGRSVDDIDRVDQSGLLEQQAHAAGEHATRPPALDSQGDHRTVRTGPTPAARRKALQHELDQRVSIPWFRPGVVLRHLAKAHTRSIAGPVAGERPSPSAGGRGVTCQVAVMAQLVDRRLLAFGQ